MRSGFLKVRGTSPVIAVTGVIPVTAVIAVMGVE